jgi:hypothetical protein
MVGGDRTTNTKRRSDAVYWRVSGTRMQPRAKPHRMGTTGSAAAPPGFPRIEGELDFLLVSLLSLYLEILLIRWIGTEIRIFAYFANLVLVTCFFGLGVGYATPRVRMSLAHGMWLVAFLCLAVHPALAPLGFRQISEAVATRDVLTWTLPTAETATRVLGFARLAFLLLGIALAFVPFGRALGDYFEREPRRLRAYSINVGGSLLGIWLFAALSFAEQPPLVWFGLLGAILLFTLRRAPRAAASAGVAVAAILALLATSTSGGGDTIWPTEARTRSRSTTPSTSTCSTCPMPTWTARRSRFRPRSVRSTTTTCPTACTRRRSGCWSWVPARETTSRRRCATGRRTSMPSRSMPQSWRSAAASTPRSPTTTRASTSSSTTRVPTSSEAARNTI